MSDEEDKKFLPKITVSYSQTIFGVRMPLVLTSFDELPQPVLSLVDSGSSGSMLHIGVATSLKLKIDKSKIKAGTGAGGAFDYVPTDPIEFSLFGQKFKIGFDVVLDDNFAWGCILGHDSIFQYSKLVFKSYKQEFDVFFRKDLN